MSAEVNQPLAANLAPAEACSTVSQHCPNGQLRGSANQRQSTPFLMTRRKPVPQRAPLGKGWDAMERLLTGPLARRTSSTNRGTLELQA
jgi:hypothetical protein